MSGAVAFPSGDPRINKPALLRMPTEPHRPKPKRLDAESDINFHKVWQALRYHAVLFLTLATLAGLACAFLGWTLFPTRYTTYALLRVDVSAPTVMDTAASGVNRSEFGTFLSTQAGLIKSHKILNRALRKPDVLHLSMLRGYDDPAFFVEEKMILDFSEKSELLKISLSGEEPTEITKIVNAIVDAYFTEVETYKQEKQSRFNKLMQTKREQEQILDDLQKSFVAQFRQPGSNEVKAKTRQNRLLRYIQLLQDESRVKYDLARTRELLASAQARQAQALELSKAQNQAQVQAQVQPKQVPTDKVDQPMPKPEELLPDFTEKIESDPIVVKRNSDLARIAAYIDYYKRTAADPESEHIKEYERRLARGHDELELIVKQKREVLKKNAMAQIVVSQATHSQPIASQQTVTPAAFAPPATTTDPQLTASVLKLTTDLEGLAVDEKNIKEELAGFADLLAEDPPAGPPPEQALAEIKLRTAQDLVTKLEHEAKIQKAELDADDRVKLIEKASVPQNREMKKQIAFTILGALAGIAMVGGLITMGELRQQRIYSHVDAIFQEVPLLGRIPEHGFVRPVSGTEPAPDDRRGVAFREAIDRLKTVVLRQLGQGRMQTLLVASPVTHEGKSILAWNLAAGIARTDQRVLFVEADLHSPTIHRHLEIPIPAGLSEVLRGERSMTEVMLRTSLPKLTCITAGHVDEEARQALDRDAFQRFIDRAKHEFDFIVFDSSALAESVDPLYVAQRVDAVLLSLRTFRSRVSGAEEAMQRFKMLGTPVIGAVLTDPTLNATEV